MKKPFLDSGAKRNGLSEADFHVLAKLGKNGLERGLEAEAFSRGQVCGEDDFLNVLVGELLDIELARQPVECGQSCLVLNKFLAFRGAR